VQKFVQKKILVTGGAGFLGSHLCEILLSIGHKVVCIDNLYTGKKANITSFSHNKNFTFVHHDITLPYEIKVDQIYNLACPASPIHYQKDPINTIQTNVIGTINMLKLAKKNNAKFLQASTSEVYGDPGEHPQQESYWGNVNPIGVRACYDEGKRCAETLCFDYHRQANVDVRVARIFNTYGPKMDPQDGRVVSNLIVQALQGNDITIFGDGSQTRSFCYVSDLVQAMIFFMELEENFPGPINLGNPAEYTISDLSKLIITLTRTRSRIAYKPLPMNDPKKRKPDINLAFEKLKWIPTTDITIGLKKTINYFVNLSEIELSDKQFILSGRENDLDESAIDI